MAVALLIIISLITVGSAYFFGQSWIPPLASAHGANIDHQFKLDLIVMGVVFFATQLALGLFVWKFRARDAKASSGPIAEPSARVELMWMAIALALFLGTNFVGATLWAKAGITGESSAKSPVQVEVNAVQFQWYFRYPGADGKFGRTDTKLQDASEGNPLGLDRNDPAAKDDVVTSVMFLPENREAELTLRAQDVIHSFFVPEFRVKQDAVPGQTIRIHFVPTMMGDFDIACAELCGLGHYRMNAKLKVVSEDEFKKMQQQPK
ncbi:MAG: cytochrome c oxidase, subunit [Acidobacteriales bacterium]|nr:cytochrome c oxidase, subunit [Terriglobales bacterium]